jgi:hypothetical protein
MALFRVEKTTGYTVMSNHHLRNAALSLKAKGLLSQMLSLPENWDYTLAGLSHINRESVDAIRTAVWELEKTGYIVRRQGRDEKGKMTAIEYIIYEQPQKENMLQEPQKGQDCPPLDCPILENPTSDNPIPVKPSSGFPSSDNPTQINKDISSKDKLNTDLSNTDSILIASPQRADKENGRETDRNDAVKAYREIIMENIEYPLLAERYPYDIDRINEIAGLMLETVCTANRTLLIAGDRYPAELVKSKFLKLSNAHIEYVLDCLRKNMTEIRNIKKYLLAVLFNAPSTMENYYTALVASDMANST